MQEQQIPNEKHQSKAEYLATWSITITIKRAFTKNGKKLFEIY